MSEIPAHGFKPQDLIDWDNAVKQLAHWKALEMTLRKRIAGHFFPNPAEGTNKHPLANGYLLNLQHGIDRKIDIGQLQAACGPQGLFTMRKFDANPIVDWDPKLKVADYKKMPAELRILMDNVLIIKPSSPSLKIELPAKAKAAQEAAAKAAQGGAA